MKKSRQIFILCGYFSEYQRFLAAWYEEMRRTFILCVWALGSRLFPGKAEFLCLKKDCLKAGKVSPVLRAVKAIQAHYVRP
jgi:hypothetical protein